MTNFNIPSTLNNYLYTYFWIIAVTGKETEFTTGSIRKAIFMLSIPMILEMLMESIFALVDIAYVSQVSVNAVATIGSNRVSYYLNICSWPLV